MGPFHRYRRRWFRRIFDAFRFRERVNPVLKSLHRCGQVERNTNVTRSSHPRQLDDPDDLKAMSSRATFNARTYGRKSVTKRKQTVETTPPKKRRKISEERESIDTEDDVGVPSYSLCASPERPKALPGVAKDLSDIFESVTPTSSPLSSPTKLAKRMLARSKTDSSIDSPSSVRIDRTPSMPNIPSSSPPKEPTFASSDPCPPPVPAVTNTRTYAGRSRSFLVAIPASSIDPEFSSVQEEDEYTARESYESLRSRWGVDNSEDDPYPLITTASPSPSTSTTPRRSPIKNGKGKIRTHQDIPLRPAPLPPGMMNPLKSITELRSKGESRRFIDEVGYLFEGMEPNGGIGLKRARLVFLILTVTGTSVHSVHLK